MRIAVAACLIFHGVVGAQSQSLAPSAAQRLDFQGDPLPVDAFVRLGSSRLQGGRIRDVAFAPDGKVVASAGYNHTIRFWDAATGKELRILTSDDRDKPFSQSRWLYCVAFSPDGKYVASGEHQAGWAARTVRIWDVRSGKIIHTMEAHKGGVLSVAFSPGGAVLASAGMDSAVSLWSVTTGASIRQYTGHAGPVRSVAFSPKGDTLVSAGDDGTVRLWEVGAAKELRKLTGHQGAVHAARFAPDGQTLASAGEDKSVRLWDVETGKERTALSGHQDAVFRLAFAPDGKTLASGGKDRTIALWDVATGNKSAALAASVKPVQGLSFSPNGNTLASCTADRVFLWDVQSGKEIYRQPGHQATVRGMQFSTDARELFSVGLDGAVKRWNWRTGAAAPLATWQKMPDWSVINNGETFHVAVSPARIALVSAPGDIQLIDTKTGRELGWLKNDNGKPISVAFSPDGATLASTNGQAVQLWDVESRKVKQVLPDAPPGVKRVCFAPTGQLLVAGSRSSRLWDVAANKLVREIPLVFDSLIAVSFSPDGNLLATGDTGGNTRIWNVADGKVSQTLPGLKGYVTTVEFSPDGRQVAAGGWRGVKVWEVATGYERRSFGDFDENALSLAFTPDGRYLASGIGDNNILIWDVPGSAVAVAGKSKEEGAFLEKLWEDLAAQNGSGGHRGVWGLVARPDVAVPYLKKHIKAPTKPDDRQVAQWVKELDDESFTVREKASTELGKLGETVETLLKRLAADPPSLEVGLRAGQLLANMTTNPQRLRLMRAVEALEHMGTPEAIALLQELAHEATGAWLTNEATAALRRQRTRIAHPTEK